MVHNGIEYGMMAAIAEGLSIIKHANAGKATQVEADAETTPLRDPEAYQYDIDVAEVAEVWRRGSVVGSWLVDLTADALARSPDLDDFAGRVSDSGEGRWTVLAAVDEWRARPGHHGARSVERFESRGLGEFTDKILSAMRCGVRRPRREDGVACTTSSRRRRRRRPSPRAARRRSWPRAARDAVASARARSPSR